MVSLKSVEKQLKKIHFNQNSWNRAETLELPNILLPDEEIYECVNGTYEGGLALLVATNVRLLLIDKKPFKFLTVEDLRYDLINQIDYNHRLFGARIGVSAGSKSLSFKSYNQERLRKLIGHVQHCMAESKKAQSQNAETQQQHLEKINQQLQAYLLTQYEQQTELRRRLEAVKSGEIEKEKLNISIPEPEKPNPQLVDYLYAQNLLRRHEAEMNNSISGTKDGATNVALSEEEASSEKILPGLPTTLQEGEARSNPQLEDLYAAGMQEIFGKQAKHTSDSVTARSQRHATSMLPGIDINPLKIAYSKLHVIIEQQKMKSARSSR